MLPEFVNTTFTDFSKDDNRKAMQAALDRVERQFGRIYPIVLGGEEIVTDDRIKSLNPSKYDEVVGFFSKGNVAHAEKAIAIAAIDVDRLSANTHSDRS